MEFLITIIITLLLIFGLEAITRPRRIGAQGHTVRTSVRKRSSIRRRDENTVDIMADGHFAGTVIFENGIVDDFCFVESRVHGWNETSRLIVAVGHWYRDQVAPS